MSLSNSSQDIISYITTFLHNKDNVSIAHTCLQLSKSSFMRSLRLDPLVDQWIFLKRWLQHSKSIRVIQISYRDNPYLMLPEYPEQLIFEHCSIGVWNPGNKAYKTKYVKLLDYNRYGNKRHLTINWSCFPNLEKLDLYVWSVDLNGIENCKKLKNIKIDKVKL